jgi:4-hydroxythreonine-4-phosphate dehydrogenase
MGDPAGIGPEVVLKVLANPEIADRFALSVVGCRSVVDTWARRLSLAAPDDIVDIGIDGIEVTPGRSTPAGARAALSAVERAARLCLAGEADAMVTAPVSKAAIAAAGHEFPGHTEFLANLTGAETVVMTFVHGRRRVALATTHLALSEVARTLTRELLVGKLRVLAKELRMCFGIVEPRIAVAALNPHASEEGRFGREEAEIIFPAIDDARKAGVHASGPYPGDTIFVGLGEPAGRGPGSGFDAVLAMYHDQGTIPIKLWGPGGGVNLTLGLPIVRTSVNHGTAFDIAGKGVADAGSMAAAVVLAGEISERLRARRPHAR